jgi:hypothetical protein
MKRDEVIAILRAQRPELEKLGVAHLSIFGSVARDEATDESDVDIVLDSVDGSAFGYFTLFSIADYLEPKLGAKVDLLTKKGLDYAPRLSRRISRDMIDVY